MGMADSAEAKKAWKGATPHTLCKSATSAFWMRKWEHKR